MKASLIHSLQLQEDSPQVLKPPQMRAFEGSAMSPFMSVPFVRLIPDLIPIATLGSKVLVVGTTNRLERLPLDVRHRAELIRFQRPESEHLATMWRSYAPLDARGEWLGFGFGPKMRKNPFGGVWFGTQRSMRNPDMALIGCQKHQHASA